MVTGTAPGAPRPRPRTMSRSSARLHRQRRAAALAGDLGDRAAEVHVDVVDPDVADQVPHRLAQSVRGSVP